MREYETVFILDPNLDESQVKDEVTKVESVITNMEGEITSVEPGGKRKLTYEIKGHKEGYYTLITFRSKPSSIAEIERAYKLNETILRHVIVHCVQKKTAVSDEKEQVDA